MFAGAWLLLFGLLTTLKNSRGHPNFMFNYYLTHVHDDAGFFSSNFDEDDASVFNLDGEDINHKIAGGSYAFEGQFPFMVVVHRLAGNGQYYVCGGSILNERWVLTAGHCVASRPRKFFVVFGIVDKAGLKYDSSSGDGVSMITTQGALHPKFKRGYNDIGLLYMPKKIPFSETISPLRIADNSYRSYSFLDASAHVYGWGKSFRMGSAIQRLKYGKVVVIPNDQCKLVWSGVDSSHVCTRSMGADVCQGDSGGPLVVFEDDDDEPLQIGIVSYGDAGCPSIRPAVFTRVSSYTDWIRKVTDIDED